MANLKGEFEVRLDDKNRLRLPSGLLRQIEQNHNPGLVISRGFNQCLLLHTRNSWEKIEQNLNKLNLFIREERNFARLFSSGATDVMPDSSSRILLPKTLLDYALIKQDVIIYAFCDQIEIWDKTLYEKIMAEEPENFAEFTENIFRHKDV